MKMNHGSLALLGACVLLLGAGCDTVNHTQYKVLGPVRVDGSHFAVSADQQEAVRQVLQAVAQELRFQERTTRSVVPNTIVSYGEPDRPYPITFVAYATKEAIVIDILHAPSEIGESERYRRVQDLILTGLKQRMPLKCVSIPDRRSQTKNIASAPLEGARTNGNLSNSDWPTHPPR